MRMECSNNYKAYPILSKGEVRKGKRKKVYLPTNHTSLETMPALKQKTIRCI